ncbi:MAG TPA: NAD+ synthase [bacterium]|nr:NAD+ synthase [bacterium]
MTDLPLMNYDKVYSELIEFIRIEMEKTGMKKAVLGLSGGLDSAIVSFLASKALGPENVTGILMPYRTSNRSSFNDAMKMVEFTGIKHKIIEITNAVDVIAKHNMTDTEHLKAIRLGNIMARVRMITLFDFSTAHDAIVFGTGNKSEILLGYFTLFGDGANAINPIGSIYKTHLFQLAEHLELPEAVIRKAPSADLFEGQTDESELGFEYRNMDPVLYALYDLKMDKNAVIAKGCNKELVEFVFKRVPSMQYKTKIPIIAKLELY